MDAQIVSVVAGVGIPLLLGGVWLIRLEGRVNVQQALHSKLGEDVQYIRERIDKALNGGTHGRH